MFHAFQGFWKAPFNPWIACALWTGLSDIAHCSEVRVAKFCHKLQASGGRCQCLVQWSPGTSDQCDFIGQWKDVQCDLLVPARW